MTQPVGASVKAGDDYEFKVVAAGTEPIKYEWYRNGSLIEDAASNVLQLKSLAAEDDGKYTVKVSNETLPWGGFDTSDEADLVVLIPLQIKVTESMLENDNGKIMPRRVTGTSAKMHRKVVSAIKRARTIGLMPFVDNGSE